MRGADPSLAPVLDWTTLDSSTLEQIRRALSQAQQPVGFRLGGAELRFTPKRVRRSDASRLRRLGTVILGILVKYKLVLVFLSVFVSLLVYGIAFGWAYGAGLIGLIIVHEFGHLVANRIKHIPSSLPIFIPLLGAFIQIKRFPQNAADEAFIGVMGPLFGLGATLIALGLAFVTHEPFFLAVALMGFLLHVFNLMPVLPLDGGRTVGFWRWKAWIPGMVGVLVVMFYNPIDNRFTFDPLAVFIVAIIILSMRREPRMHSDQYTAISARSRWLYTSLWGFALALSIAGYWGIGQLAQVRPL
jgi:Zn-dependent protease